MRVYVCRSYVSDRLTVEQLCPETPEYVCERKVLRGSERTTTWHDANPCVHVQGPLLQIGLPRPFVKVMLLLEEEDEPVPRACAAATQASLLEQTPQVGPSKPFEHCRLHPALAFPASTGEKGCL